MQIQKMQMRLNNSLIGRSLQNLILLLKHTLTVIGILILMTLSLGLLASWIGIISVCFFAIGMICCTRGFMKDAEKLKNKEIVD